MCRRYAEIAIEGSQRFIEAPAQKSRKKLGLLFTEGRWEGIDKLAER